MIDGAMLQSLMWCEGAIAIAPSSLICTHSIWGVSLPILTVVEFDKNILEKQKWTNKKRRKERKKNQISNLPVSIQYSKKLNTFRQKVRQGKNRKRNRNEESLRTKKWIDVINVANNHKKVKRPLILIVVHVIFCSFTREGAIELEAELFFFLIITKYLIGKEKESVRKTYPEMNWMSEWTS